MKNPKQAPPMRQRHYNALITHLGAAMREFIEIEGTEKKAQKAMLEFLEHHYFPVWRAIDRS